MALTVLIFASCILMLVGEHGLYWASGMGRIPSMLGHSMREHTMFLKTSVQSAEAFRGGRGAASPES